MCTHIHMYIVHTYYICVYHGGFQKYNRKVDIYEYHHISLMFVSIQLLCIGKFYTFCIPRANLTLQVCWKSLLYRGAGRGGQAPPAPSSFWHKS